MSKHKLFLDCYRQAKAAGFSPTAKKAPEAASPHIGFRAVLKVCNYKIYPSGPSIRLDVSFGQGRPSDLSINKKAYQKFELFAASNKVKELFDWVGPGKGLQNYVVNCGQRNVDFGSEESISEASQWIINRMAQSLPFLEQCFGKIERHK